MKTPDFVLASSVRSRSDFLAAASTYSSTAARASAVTLADDTSGCSGATTTYVAPKSVSARVVYTSTTSPSLPATLNATVAPSDRPIQLRCMSLIDSSHSSPSRSPNRRSPYCVIFNIHCLSGIRTTGCPPRSLSPSITSSFASTVPNAGHQFTGTSALYASPRFNSCRKIHCVHL